MRSSSFPTLFALLLCFLPILALSADHELAPPFRLHWGESAIHLEEALLGTTAKIVERQTLPDSREVWKVQGLPGIALQQVNFYLHKSQLVEVELQYWKDDWSPQTYEEFMQNVRQGLEEKFQAGKPLTRQQSTEHGIARTLLGFRWEVGPAAIELFYFAAQDPKNVFRSISLGTQRQ
ncbi:MAG: hypothetical protein NTX04_09005, partial [Verrucomicrobia bacterium]|nr:hypothetical protein [Verrucomicrobiota bacterium]